MKKIWFFALLILVFFVTGICAAEVPNLIGNWTGSWSGYNKGEGFSGPTENGSFMMDFTEQKGRIFAGNMTYKQDNATEVVEGFVGAIGLDNKTLHIAEFDKGYDLGTIISNDEIELIYLEDGKNETVAIDRVYRIKA